MISRIERKIKQIYEIVFKKVFNNQNINALSKGARSEVELSLAKLSSSQQYNEFCEKFSKELAKQGIASQKGIWRKYYKAAKQAHYIALPKTFSEYELNVLNKATQEAFTAIKSIPNNILEVLNHKYTTTLIEEVAKGSRPRGSFKNMLMKHGYTNAKLIARTETAKLQTTILENRATDLGSIAYEWLSSNDRRTRPSHRKMNSVIVFWKHPKPELDNMIGHAGEFPNCRCTPLPIMDEDDLTKSSYHVYNYITKNIIIMKRSELLKALREGHL